ncbi:hypothetical protein PIB30_082636, partial [Stylosanthes scabra]|nr:hypothetical protein [Stylosanthes scabra]
MEVVLGVANKLDLGSSAFVRTKSEKDRRSDPNQLSRETSMFPSTKEVSQKIATNFQNNRVQDSGRSPYELKHGLTLVVKMFGVAKG